MVYAFEAEDAALLSSGGSSHILAMNSGSSSIKFSLYYMETPELLVFSGAVDDIGEEAGRFHVKDGDGDVLADRQVKLRDHDAALELLLAWLRPRLAQQDLDAVGYRIVHGGTKYVKPQGVTGELVASLREFVPFAPYHLPAQLADIGALTHAYPRLFHVACFDTAFHRRMPHVAQMYALPGSLAEEGVIRYGFHGLSYEYVLADLAQELGRDAARRRLILAHLGNGASMAAVKDGHSVETTMGFTPTGGLVMSTRSGDIDPGVLLYLLQEKRMRPRDVGEIVTRRGGLLGVSGLTSDMETLLAREGDDNRAAEAVELFCYQAKKFVGALAAVLGGVDGLVFTGGIGEHAPEIRSRVCRGFDFLGIRLDAVRNDMNERIISTDDSRAFVRVIKTNEELMIARHTRDVLMGKGESNEQRLQTA